MVDLLWVVLASATLVVAAECGARWWLRYRRDYYVFQPGLRLRMRPASDVCPEIESLVRFDVNADGERGDEAPRSVDGLYRVLVAGGSNPEGYLLDQDTSWPGALQRLLERPECLRKLKAHRVHVGNIGRSGVGTEALDCIFERVLPRYPRLQLIVVLVGVSDVSRWLQHGAPPYPPPGVRTSDLFKCHPEGPFDWKPRNLALVHLLERLRIRWFRSVQVDERAGTWMKQARAMRARATEMRATMPEPTPMLDHFERHLRRALATAKRHADRVLVVRQPWLDKDYTPEEAARMWHAGIGEPWRQKVTAYYSDAVFCRLMALLDVRAEAVSRALGVEQFDPKPILEQSLRTYYDCFHLAPAGARALAAAVADTIVRPHESSEATCADDACRGDRADLTTAHPRGDRPSIGHRAALLATRLVRGTTIPLR